MDDTPAHSPQRRPARKLKVDLVDLAQAFDNNSLEAGYFLDLETGRTIMITDDMRGEYEAVCATIGDVEEGEWAAAFEAALKEWETPDWQREVLREVDQVETDFGKRVIRVPQTEARAGYRDMVGFIETVTNKRLAEHLERAIEGRGAFRRFKDVLLDYPSERERWFAFKDARQRERILEWLESLGIEPEAEAGK
jgi:hypothetical protein